jgi:hypothetical protein
MRDTPGRVPGKQVTLVRGAAMLRKLACVGIMLTFCLSVCMAEEFVANIKKIEGNKVTLIKGGKFNKDTKKFEGGEEMTLTAAKDVKVMKGGKFNKDTKKIEGGEEVAGGVKAEPLANIGEKGAFGFIVTDDNKKITEIHLMQKKGKKGA